MCRRRAKLNFHILTHTVFVDEQQSVGGREPSLRSRCPVLKRSGGVGGLSSRWRWRSWRRLGDAAPPASCLPACRCFPLQDDVRCVKRRQRRTGLRRRLMSSPDRRNPSRDEDDEDRRQTREDSPARRRVTRQDGGGSEGTCGPSKYFFGEYCETVER